MQREAMARKAEISPNTRPRGIGRRRFPGSREQNSEYVGGVASLETSKDIVDF